MEIGQYEKAISDYNKTIDIEPNFPEPFIKKGEALEKLGRDAEAKKCFDVARSLGYKG